MRDTCWCGGRLGHKDAFASSSDPVVCLDSDQHDPLADGRRDHYTVIYVAGPMSGRPDNNYPAFNEAAARLRDAGYTVINPAEFVPEPGKLYSYPDLLRHDLQEMLQAHAVATLDEWWESTGGRNEVNIAGLLKMPVRPVADWLERAFQELS